MEVLSDVSYLLVGTIWLCWGFWKYWGSTDDNAKRQWVIVLMLGSIMIAIAGGRLRMLEDPSLDTPPPCETIRIDGVDYVQADCKKVQEAE